MLQLSYDRATPILVKLADAVEHALAERAESGRAGLAEGRLLASGEGWSVHDVVCSCRPGDRPFEEQHSGSRIAIVVSGTFQYSIGGRRVLMTPGSLLLGSDGECFTCGHEYAGGDRCVSFRYAPEYLEAVLAGANLRRADAPFDRPRLPAMRGLSALAARACNSLLTGDDDGWDELGVRLAVGATELLQEQPPQPPPASPRIERRVTDMLRAIERAPGSEWTLATLARRAAVSQYQFLRTFERLTGVSPHQYVMRMRLREAATRLVQEAAKVLDVALDCGFGDVSNFNHAFKREFGVSPREYRVSPQALGSPVHDCGR